MSSWCQILHCACMEFDLALNLFTKARCMQEGMRRRDAEIARLGNAAQAGCDVDALSLQYRSQAQEEMILQLNHQVGLCLHS